jgi:eukaryotic-like serine/threonine-protein kinase
VPALTQGSLLAGRYRVLSRLGAGGMASVLLCHDERLDRRVAVKRLHADSPGEIEQRFVREAKLGASLNHPNLVSVYDTAVEDEGVLIVMEYVQGESLAQALLRGRLEPAHVAGIAEQLGDALDHVHGQGVVHRDVKPGNVLLRDDGMVKLADLGIAVSIDQTRVTQSGVVLGSAAYMAPEQLEGREIGPAADVYALAAVCFEALTGEKARPGRTPVEIAHSVATTPPPDVRAHVPELSAAAADALRRGMALDPAERPRTAVRLAAELADALRRPPRAERHTRAADTAPTQRVATTAPRGPASAPGSRGATASRRRPIAGLLATALIALAAAAAVAAVLLSNDGGDGGQRSERPAQEKQSQAQQREPESSQTAPQPSEPEPADEPAASDTTASVDPARGAALNEQGFELMGQGDFAGAVPLLRQAVASWPEDSTDLEYAYALFNLGKSLNQSGNPAEAIPYLEKRLNWSNQRGVVKKELELARQNAGQG